MRVVLILLLLLPAMIVDAQNFTNKGKEFWVGYGHNQFFDPSVGKNPEMVIYLSAIQAATVTVSISGTSWTRTYNIPANTVIVSDIIPRTGADDCRITGEGLFSKAVHIESDVEIVAYAHVYGNWSSGAAMLLPVVSYGYTYYSLNSEQNFDQLSHSWFYVVASEDNTRVRITTSGPTVGGRVKNVPFEVNLNKGQVYNVMGTVLANNKGTDMSGSKIVSIVGNDGKCHPISVFSGSSRTYVECVGLPGIFPGGDFIMQQVFPFNAWGTRYLAGVASGYAGATTLTMNKFRVYVSDPTTRVYNNGVLVTGLTNGIFYEFSTITSPYITATKPVMVAQILPSSNTCGTDDNTDPEMIYITPMEQAINQVSFYSTNKETILKNYLTLVIPTSGLGSLLIDGSNTFDYTYPHPGLPGHTVVVHTLPATPGQHNVIADVGFTAITYGMGFAESYGYNAGCYINNLILIPEVQNPVTNVPLSSICNKTPFNLFAKSIYQLTAITWHFSEVPGATPNTDLTVNNPVQVGTEVLNGQTYYIYKTPQPFSIERTGTYYIPVTITTPKIDNCSNSEKIRLKVDVTPGPTAEFTTTPVCAMDSALFTGSSPDAGVDGYRWTFPDGSTDPNMQTKKQFIMGGTYPVNFQVSRSLDACMGDTTKLVSIFYKPAAGIGAPAIVCMPGGQVQFNNLTTMQGGISPSVLMYSWETGDGGRSNSFSHSHVYSAIGSYPVTLIAESPQGCRDTASLVFDAFSSKPLARFGASDTAFCEGKETVFSDSTFFAGGTSGASWSWQFGDGTSGNGAKPSKMFARPGTYNVSMTATNTDGCASDAFVKAIDVYEVPDVSAGEDIITEPGRSVTLHGSVTPAGATIIWTPASYLSNTSILNPLATPPANQLYVLTATGAHCSAADSVLVKVFRELKVPNAFTPNGDGHNDVWNIPGLVDYKNASVQIFNRWGQVVYRSTGYSRPWDGSLNGNQLSTGSYYYVIHPKDYNQPVLTGFVMLIR